MAKAKRIKRTHPKTAKSSPAKSPPKKKRVLGRGLDALLGDVKRSNRLHAPPLAVGQSATVLQGAQDIPVERIEANPFQPRGAFQEEALQSLAASISTHGIIQPLTVRRLGGTRYQLIAGERRLQACKRLGLSRVPAFVRVADDQGMLEMALIENIQREDLNPIEIALSYQRLVEDCQLTQEAVGKRMGKDRSTVTNYLRLLSLPPDIQSALKENVLSMGHAKSILSLKEVTDQLSMLHEVLNKRLSVRETERLVAKYAPRSIAQKKGGRGDKKMHPMTAHLRSHYGTKVQVTTKGDSGEIRIPFYSAEDFERILEIMQLS